MKYLPVINFVLLVVLISVFALPDWFNKNEDVGENEVAKSTVFLPSFYNSPKDYGHITKAIKIPDYLEFAGEPMPLHDDEVKEKVDRELLVNTFWHSNTIYNLKLANKFFPIIEPILAENGIPDDFKYLAVAESGLKNVVSPSKAAGYWQFLSGTAKEFGLEVNGEVDERYHIEKSTKAACKYLNQAYSKYGNWTLAAASYNMGMKNTSRLLELEKESSYYDMHLNIETGRYVYRCVAIKEIFSNPEKYGFALEYDDLFSFPSIKLIQVDHPIESMADFAHQYGVSYKTLKYLNPWLKSYKLDNKEGKTYRIKIPI